MAKKVPFDDPQVLTYVRIAYVATQVVVLGVYFYVGQQVRPRTLHLIALGGEDSLLTRTAGRSRRRTTRRCSSMVRPHCFLSVFAWVSVAERVSRWFSRAQCDGTWHFVICLAGGSCCPRTLTDFAVRLALTWTGPERRQAHHDDYTGL